MKWQMSFLLIAFMQTTHINLSLESNKIYQGKKNR